MKTVRLIATDLLPYGGQNFKKGAEFDASESDAKVLVHIGKAALVKPAKIQARPLEPAVSRSNQDMGATNSGATASAEAKSAIEQPAAPAGRRTTPRRRTNQNRATQPSQIK